MSAFISRTCVAALALGALSIPPAVAAGPAPKASLNTAAVKSHIVRVDHDDDYYDDDDWERDSYYRYERRTTVDAPYTYVERDGRRVRVEAPFADVGVDDDHVRVRAPFVDLWIPK